MKFGNTVPGHQTCTPALNLSGRQFTRLLSGQDVSDGLIERLEELSDHLPNEPHIKSKRGPKEAESRRYKEIQKKLSHIPKPKKHRKDPSSITINELKEVGEMLFGEDWIVELARLIGYSPFHVRKFMNGDTTRFISEETANYIRRAGQIIRASGEFTGASLSKSR